MKKLLKKISIIDTQKQQNNYIEMEDIPNNQEKFLPLTNEKPAKNSYNESPKASSINNMDNIEIQQRQSSQKLNDSNNDSKSEQRKKNKEKKQKKLNWKKIIPRTLIIAVIITLIVLVIVKRKAVNEEYKNFIQWLSEHQAAGFFSLIGIYILATISFFPGSILTLGAGYCFNQALGNQFEAVMVGGLAVFIGAQIGSTLALIISRYILRELFETYALKWTYFKAIDQVVGIEGFKVVLLLRLAPIAPFNLLNYFFGITSVKLKHYMLGGFGMIPGTFVYVYFGTSISQISDVISGNYDGGATYIIFMVVGVVITLAGIIYIGIIAKKEFSKIINQEKEKKRQEQEQEQEQEENENKNKQSLNISQEKQKDENNQDEDNIKNPEKQQQDIPKQINLNQG
ncbi:hypothetical protein PPERSA_03174 [Pseudocohnilembus persalinus]|uniref:VTT domain-containing protein n=1 Tax=Pseudocohnilembus persalinus TaxID=266149 RepID=A0A0V0QDY8_PSEPJ|nr:hypothetical protein PPERSA_03174 [Pseudocohnilembus persalinus]|eukprot:KRX00441.1 hypothetical protein PPERSA_03174 [Pseudocohnilembus persalinus]